MSPYCSPFFTPHLFTLSTGAQLNKKPNRCKITGMLKYTQTHRLTRLPHVGMTMLFLLAGGLSFVLGIKSVNDLEPIKVTGAQTAQTTNIGVVLQYTPVAGGAALPLVVTQVMNSSQTALVNLQEIHNGLIQPVLSSDRCRTTNTTGRCNISNVPVGGNPASQYDILIDTVFLEFLT